MNRRFLACGGTVTETAVVLLASVDVGDDVVAVETVDDCVDEETVVGASVSGSGTLAVAVDGDKVTEFDVVTVCVELGVVRIAAAKDIVVVSDTSVDAIGEVFVVLEV